MSRLLGDAYIAILPDATGFGSEAKSQVTKALSSVRGDVRLDAKLSEASVAKVKATLKAITGHADLGVSISAFQVAKIKAQLASIASSVNLGAQLDAGQLAKVKAQLKAIADSISVDTVLDPAALAKVRAELKSLTDSVPLGVRMDPAQLARTKASIQAYMANNVELGFSVDPVRLAILKNQVGTFMANNAVPLHFNISAAQLVAAKAALNSYMAANPANLWLNVTPAMARVTGLWQLTQALFSKTGTVLKVNVGPAIARIFSLRAAIASLNSTFTQVGRRANVVAAISAAAAARTATAFIQGAGTGWGFLSRQVVLFAGVLDKVLPKMLTRVGMLHLAADWIVEFGAVFIPAAIAVTAWGAAITPVFQDAYLRLQAVRNAASATGTAIGIFNYSTSGAIGPLQALQNKLQPTVWELFGDALNVITKRTGVFSSVVMSVNQVVQNLAARMTAAFQSQAAANFLKNGALDFQRFGTIIGNIGGAIGNIIKDVPGYAAVIQELFVKLTYGIETFTAIAGPIIKAGLALHGFFLYAGLATTAGVALLSGLGNLITKFFTYATAATSMAGIGSRIATSFQAAGTAAAAFGKNLLALATNPYVLAIAAIGAAVYEMTVHWNSASSSVDNFVTNLQTKIDNLQGGAALQTIPEAFGEITRQIKLASSPQAYNQIAANWNNLSNTGNAFAKDSKADLHDWGKAVTDLVHNSNPLLGLFRTVQDAGIAVWHMIVPGQGIRQQVNSNLAELQASFNHLASEEKNLLTVTGQLMTGQTGSTKVTFSYAQSLGILNAAGVQAGDSLQTMQIKVQGLLTGWAQFGLSAGQVGNSVNALALQTEMGQTAITKLTGAYSNFIQTVTTGETSFATFGQGMSTLAQSLSQAGAQGVTFSDRLGTISVRGTAAGASLNGVSQASLAVRGAFAQQVINAQNLYNSLLTLSSVSADGAKGQTDLAAAGKDMVAMLLPLAKGSKAATAEVYALAQVAGYGGADSFQKLSEWVGRTNNPMQDLNKREQALTVTSANLLKDTQNLAGAMGQTLTTAISNAIFVAEKGPVALQGLANAMQALVTGKGSANAVTAALRNFLPALIQMTGSLPNAKAQFLAMAGSMHIGQQQAMAMWNAVTGGQQPLQSVSQLTKTFNSDLQALASAGINVTAKKAHELWAELRQQYLDTLSKKAGETRQAFVNTAVQLGLTKQAADDLWGSLHKLAAGSPYDTSLSEHIAGAGTVLASTSGMSAIGQKDLKAQLTFQSMIGHEAGGVVRGPMTAHDSQVIAAKPGELIIPTQHAAKFGDMARRSGIPGFAGGGVVGAADSMANTNANSVPWSAALMQQFSQEASQGFASAMLNATKAAVNAAVTGPMGGPLGGATGSEMANGLMLYRYLLQNVFGGNQIAAAGATASIWGESNWDPFAVGTGGRGLIGWTPEGTISDAAFSGGMATQLPAIIRFISTSGDWGVINLMKQASSVTQAAWEWGKGVERFGIPDVHPEGIALATAFMTQGNTGMSGTTASHHFAGGMIHEPVFGFGAFSGVPYSFAERGPEQVIPGGAAAHHMGGMRQPMTATQGQQLLTVMQTMVRLLQNQPYAYAQALSKGAGNGVKGAYYAAGG